MALPKFVSAILLLLGFAAGIGLLVAVIAYPAIYLAKRFRGHRSNAMMELLVEQGFTKRASNPCQRVERDSRHYFVASESYDGKLAQPSRRAVTIVLGNWYGEQYLVNRIMVPVTLPCYAAYFEPSPGEDWLRNFASGRDVRLAKAAGAGALVVWTAQPDANAYQEHMAALSNALAGH